MDEKNEKNEKVKKILVVDDSALMRRIVYDIINSDERFCVQDVAANGVEALKLLEENTYDVVILDVVMPMLNGLEVLEEIGRRHIETNVIMFSTETGEGAETTIRALELGAFDFIHKPDSILGARSEQFIGRFISILECAAFMSQREKTARSKAQENRQRSQQQKMQKAQQQAEAQSQQAAPQGQQTASQSPPKKTKTPGFAGKIVAIASSTGGPKALAEVVPYLPKNLDAPVLIVQHMPAGFTASLAERLDETSRLHVQEAEDGMELKKGNVYIAKGGKHMEVERKANKHVLRLLDGPTREGVRPCANFMYESLGQSGYSSVVCVVLTGMGADGTAGIKNLKEQKPIYVIAQEQSTCAVYGMPRCVVAANLADQIEPLSNIAEAITTSVGVQ